MTVAVRGFAGTRLAVAMLAAAVIGSGCTAGDPRDDGGDLLTRVTVRSGPHSALSAVVIIETSAPARASVVAATESGRLRPPDSPTVATRHEIPLVGLRADTNYTVTATVTSPAGDTDTGAPIRHTSGALPAWLPALDVRSEPERMAEGVTLFPLQPWTRDRTGPRGYAVAVDARGEVVWYYETEDRVSDVSMSPRGTFLVTLEDVRIREIDVLGNVIRELRAQRADDVERSDAEGAIAAPIDSMHHDASILPNGNLLTLSTEVLPLDATVAATACPQNPPQLYAADVVVEVAPNGNVVTEWHLADTFDPGMRPGRELCEAPNPAAPPNVFYPELPDLRDWTHANAAVFDERNNAVIVSLRHLDAVVAIRYADDENGPSGEVLWELGPDGTLDLLAGSWPSYQHAPEPPRDGTLLLYDNGNRRATTISGGGAEPDYSRAVRYDINRSRGTARETWEHRDTTPNGAPVYAWFLGDADQLDNGNVLITHGGTEDPNGVLYARLVEVDPDDGDDIVFDLTVGDGTDGGWTVYRADRLPSLYAHTPRRADR